MFSWKCAKKLFDAFTILRWTDFIKPIEFVQMEKSAMQAILSYIIGKEYEERTNNALDWDYIVESNIYGLLCKIATSDIKSTISNKIIKDHLKELKKFIINVYFDKSGKSKYGLDGIIDKKNLERYIIESNTTIDKIGSQVEYEICYSAHKFATYREFCYIRQFNELSPDTSRVEYQINPTAIVSKLKDKNVISIISELADKQSRLCCFFSYFEKLKPQIRWSQTCRLPLTTVLGHSMYVAVLTCFAIKEFGVENNENRVLVDSFFAALFHDLPESLTRDIISPVKRNIENLEEHLAEYEYQEVNEKMISQITEKRWAKDFLRLLGETDDKKFNAFSDREYIFGELISYIDKSAAFMEAKMSVNFGVDSDELQKGIEYCSNKIKDKVFEYRENDWKKSKNVLKFNDFLASIPHYNIGVNTI